MKSLQAKRFACNEEPKMSINGIGGGFASSYSPSKGISSSSGGPKMPSEQEMQAKLKELKSSNPELAAKMEKVGNRMKELQKSGVSQEDAMKTIQKEFGKPSKSEMQALGGGSNGSSSFDVSSFLDSKSSNDAVLSMMSSRTGSHKSSYKSSN